jgi:hypothetical protein
MTDEKLPEFTLDVPGPPDPPSTVCLWVRGYQGMRRGHINQLATLADLRAVLDAMTPEQREAVIPEFWRGAVAGERLQRARAEAAERERDDLREKLDDQETRANRLAVCVAKLEAVAEAVREFVWARAGYSDPGDTAAAATTLRRAFAFTREPAAEPAVPRAHDNTVWQRVDALAEELLGIHASAEPCPEVCPPRITEEPNWNENTAPRPAVPAPTDEAHPACVAAALEEMADWYATPGGIDVLRKRAAEWRAKGGSR